ncbi:alpha/beta hydrolase-fold protein [uncultured Gimesia sp.]|uniref:alpha/beta hydrolase n=1 Tax=uncultured Gimesia sp. TaxID=1678688 RepID=UPI0026236A4B|nr:alpha/beta hydrolase-fold protein [uncultured Gimesia sp.]
MKNLVFAGLVVAQILDIGLACSADSETEATKLETVELFPRIVAVSFHSASLNKRKRCVVVLPVDWQQIEPADRRTLVMLHGRGRHELSLIDDKTIRKQLLDSGLFVILPDGDDGWYVNSPVRKPDVYATYLEEVLAVISQEFQLPAKREQWAIAGWSMGGFGCVNFAERHPERFAAVSSIIGLLDFPRTGLPAGQSYKVPAERFGTDETVWEQFNPLRKAEKLKEMSVLIITADEAFDRTMNEHFRDRLIKLNQPQTWILLKGGHTFPVVKEAMPLVLAFTKKILRKSQGE